MIRCAERHSVFLLVWRADVADLDVDMLRGLVDSARLSTAQLDNIAQAVMGTALINVSNRSLPAEQAEDLMRYAEQYGQVRQLAEAVIEAAGGRAALQVLLLGDRDTASVTSTGDGDRQVGANGYNLLRVETKLDRVIERLDSIDRRQAAFEEAMHRRVNTLETAPSRAGPSLSITTERLLVALLALLMVSMLAYNVMRWPTP